MIKSTEFQLWEKLKDKTLQGRRTEVLAQQEKEICWQLWVIATARMKPRIFSEKVHKALALAAYRSSVNMAKERGALRFMMPKERLTTLSSTV